jgi:gliding motility-associated-like protein
MQILLRYLLIVFVVVLAGNIAFAQRNITYIDIPEPNFIQNQLPSYSEFRQAEMASVNSVNSLLLPLVGRTLITTCSNITEVIYIDVTSSSNRQIAFLPTATSNWLLISRNGPAWIELTPDTTFYVAEMNATLDTIGPRVAITYRYTPPPSQLEIPEQITLCEGEDYLLRFNNPEGLVVSFTGGFSGSTTADSIIIPSTASGRVTAVKSNGCEVRDEFIINPAIPVPNISPNRFFFCYEPEDVFIFNASVIEYNLFRRLDDAQPALRLMPGERIPASFFIDSDSVFYIQAQVTIGCNARKQRISYNILRDSSNAGNDVEACIRVPVRLNATAPRIGQTGIWQENTNVTFSDRNNPNSTVSGNNAGLFELIWEVTNPQCPVKTDKVNFSVSGFNPIRVDSSFIICQDTFEIPYLADANVQIGLYRDSSRSNPLILVNSGSALKLTQNRGVNTYYIGYVNSDCEASLKPIQVIRPETPQLNIQGNYKLCKTSDNRLIINNPVLNAEGQPIKVGAFTTTNRNLRLSWNFNGTILDIQFIQPNNVYTINYQYALGNCTPTIGTFTINTLGYPPRPSRNLSFVSCSSDFELRIPNVPNGFAAYILDLGGTSLSDSSDNGVFNIQLVDSITNFYYGFYSGECGQSNALNVTIRKANPFVRFFPLPDLAVDAGALVQLTKEFVQPGFTYSWSNNLSNEVYTNYNTALKPDRSTVYYLQVVSPENCEYFDTINVTVNSEFDLPNMFTPNGNGQNETFGIPAKLNISVPYELTIVNKYGQIVFNKSGQYAKWNGDLSNGNPAPQDTYYYRIRFSEGLDEKKGSVQLVR